MQPMWAENAISILRRLCKDNEPYSRAWYNRWQDEAAQAGVSWSLCVDLWCLTGAHPLEDVERIIPLIPFMDKQPAGKWRQLDSYVLLIKAAKAELDPK